MSCHLFSRFLAALWMFSPVFAAEHAAGSQFEISQGKRNPFWPIGYQQSAAPQPSAAVGPLPLKAADFVLTSIFLGASPRMALINGNDYVEGETIVCGPQKLKVQLVTIYDGGVILQCGNEKITVLLRRR